MDSQKRSKSISVEECREFLVAVVNNRPRLLERYEGWFPRQIFPDGDEYASLLSLYRRLAPLWVHPKVSLSEPPRDVTSLYVLLLQHKLRVVWERALGHQNPAAAVRRLWAETYEIDHVRKSILHGKWADVRRGGRARPSRTESYEEFAWRFDRIEQAMQWLQESTHTLIKCANPDCTRNTYFIRPYKKSNQKYCGQFCSELVETERVRQRFPMEPKGNSRLSPEGRARIVAGQKKRWDQHRKNMKPRIVETT